MIEARNNNQLGSNICNIKDCKNKNQNGRCSLPCVNIDRTYEETDPRYCLEFKSRKNCSGQNLANAMRELAKKEGWKIETISIKIKYKKDVGAFIREIERAHKKAAKSKLIFTGIVLSENTSQNVRKKPFFMTLDNKDIICSKCGKRKGEHNAVHGWCPTKFKWAKWDMKHVFRNPRKL